MDMRALYCIAWLASVTMDSTTFASYISWFTDKLIIACIEDGAEYIDMAITEANIKRANDKKYNQWDRATKYHSRMNGFKKRVVGKKGLYNQHKVKGQTLPGDLWWDFD